MIYGHPYFIVVTVRTEPMSIKYHTSVQCALSYNSHKPPADRKILNFLDNQKYAFFHYKTM